MHSLWAPTGTSWPHKTCILDSMRSAIDGASSCRGRSKWGMAHRDITNELTEAESIMFFVSSRDDSPSYAHSNFRYRAISDRTCKYRPMRSE